MKNNKKESRERKNNNKTIKKIEKNNNVKIFIFVIVKVFYIQVIEYKKLNNLANELWSRDLTVQADRGKILDRNGKVIVDNVTTVGLYLVPNQIINKEEVSKTLSSILEVSYEEMYKHVTKKTSIERVHPEGRNISHEKADLISSYNYEGVYLLKESKRDYKYGNILSHVIGYTGIDNQGLSGIELKYDKTLTGKNGNIKYYSDGKGKRLSLPETYVSPTSGSDVTLTIDLDIQLSLENELMNAYKKYDAEGAIGIVMNPKSGEILAISSIPSFNPANYKNYSSEIINRNLAIWSNFEPGSTFKIVTLASAINEGKVDIFKEHFYDSGSIKVANSTLHCWKRKGHGDETFIQVVENSCNPGFVNLGQRLGKETLFKYITELGFGKKTGIDLNGEGNGILFSLDKMGNVELATTAFGQGISVTPIQQVGAVSAIVNGGTLYSPFLVKNYLEPETNTIIKSVTVQNKGTIIKKETSDLVKYALESVVAKGSGHNAYIENYRIGGKTGTAQTVENGRYSSSKYILSFIGFMPADDPEIVVYVAVQNAKGVVQYGGTVAAPIARNIFLSAIDILDIKPDSEGIPKEYTWLDQKYVVVPDVVGMNIDAAKRALKGFNIEYSGEGETVIYESPKGGMYAKENGTIVLMLN
mgnify:CR=1 FL=1